MERQVDLSLRWLVVGCSLILCLVGGCSDRAVETGPAAGLAVKNELVTGAGSTAAGTAPAGTALRAKTQSAEGAQRGLQLLPEEPRAGDTLMAVLVGGSGAVTYVWRRNGEVLAEGSADRLSPAGWRRGDSLSVTVSDQLGEQSAERTVVDTPPTVRDVVIAASNPHRGVDVKIEPSGEDADGEAVSFTYVWLLNGETIIGAEGPVLPGDKFVRDDRISFMVTPVDDAGPGEPYRSRDIVVENAPPVFTSTLPTTFSTPAHRFTARAKDADGDVISYSLDAAPPGASIDSASGLLQWDLSGVPAGNYHISIVADDGAGLKAHQGYSITLGEDR